MNGRFVRKTLSFSKELHLLNTANTLEEALCNFIRPIKTLRVELTDEWALRSQDAFILKRASSSQYR